MSGWNGDREEEARLGQILADMEDLKQRVKVLENMVAKLSGSHTSGLPIPSWASKEASSVYSPEDKRGLLLHAEYLFRSAHMAKAVPLLERLASWKMGRAMYLLGECYCLGMGGIERNEETAAQYYRDGAALGDVLCQLHLESGKKQAGMDAQETVSGIIGKVKEKADQRDLFAQFEMAQYLFAQSREQEGEVWLRKSADQGYWRALRQVAVMEKDADHLDNAIACYQKEYELEGETAGLAAYECGSCYTDLGNTQNAADWYRKGAGAGDEHAMYQLAACFEKGEGVRKNRPKALKWYQNAYDRHGEMAGESAFHCAYLYIEMQNYEQARAWGQKGEDENHSWSMMVLARLYEHGLGGERDEKRALDLFQKAYAQHDGAAGSAAYDCGKLYDIAFNDLNSACGWYEKGAEEEYIPSVFELAKCYAAGSGTDKDMKKADQLYRKVYESGDEKAGEAALQCGLMLQESGDETSAVEWFQKGADVGQLSAMCQLADCYAEGKGASKDIEKAKALYQSVFDKHEEDAGQAADRCGLLFQSAGDDVSAVEWFQKGAQEGNADAMINLSSCLRNGRGIRRDPDAALAWFDKGVDILQQEKEMEAFKRKHRL